MGALSNLALNQHDINQKMLAQMHVTNIVIVPQKL